MLLDEGLGRDVGVVPDVVLVCDVGTLLDVVLVSDKRV